MASYTRTDPMKYPVIADSDHTSAVASLAVLEGTSSKSDPGQDRAPSYSFTSLSNSVETYPLYPPPVTIPMESSPGDDNAGKSPPLVLSCSDDRRCRICFEGEIEPEMGKLISPCLCKGSSRYIHLQCLQRWREQSHRSDSYYQCDTCRYHYSFSRPWVAKMLSQKWFVHVLTTICVILFIYGLGWVGRAVDTRGLWHWKNIYGQGSDLSTWTRVLGLDGLDYLFGVALTAILGLLGWIIDGAFAAVRSRGGADSSMYSGCCALPAGCCGFECGWGAASGEVFIIMIFVVILLGGLYAAFYGVYTIFASLNQKALDRMKEAILEVN